jgi:inhibitor of KinA sporulation pathway (predicted exonuclease)
MPTSTTILVVDVEATCWLFRSRSSRRDILQIGAVVLDAHEGTITQASALDVRPTSTRVGLYCSLLTGITPARAAAAAPFAHACEWLRTRYRSNEMPWASFGEFDRDQFAAQCAREGLANPLSANHMDIQRFAAVLLGATRRRSLLGTMRAMGLTWEGQHHFARDDAFNAARILAALMP